MVVVDGGRDIWPEGAALSSCFLAFASSDAAIACARSFHTESKIQKMLRAVSRTAALGSPRARLKLLSSTSAPPVASINPLTLVSVFSSTVLICPSAYCLMETFLSCTPAQSRGRTSRGCGETLIKISLAVFCVSWATIFLVNEPMRNKGTRVSSEKGS